MKISRHSAVWFRSALLALSIGASAGWAQFTSSIEGTVVDPAAARIPGASVIVLNTETGIKTTTETNNIGYFLLPTLPPGNFRVTISGKGFKTTEVSDVKLEADQRRTLNVALDVGTQSATVSVQAEAAAVEVSDVRLASTLETRQLIELPTGGQAFMA